MIHFKGPEKIKHTPIYLVYRNNVKMRILLLLDNNISSLETFKYTYTNKIYFLGKWKTLLSYEL